MNGEDSTEQVNYPREGEPPRGGGALGQVLRFAAVGLLTTLIDNGFHYGLWFGSGLVHAFPPGASDVAYGLLKALTFGIGMAVGFTINRSWTFEAADGQARRQARRFAVVSLSALCLNALIAAGANAAAGGGKKGWFVGAVLGTIVATGLSFTGHRRWTFA